MPCGTFNGLTVAKTPIAAKRKKELLAIEYSVERLDGGVIRA